MWIYKVWRSQCSCRQLKKSNAHNALLRHVNAAQELRLVLKHIYCTNTNKMSNCRIFKSRILQIFLVPIYHEKLLRSWFHAEWIIEEAASCVWHLTFDLWPRDGVDSQSGSGWDVFTVCRSVDRCSAMLYWRHTDTDSPVHKIEIQLKSSTVSRASSV